MAARFWRFLLGCELLFAAAVTALLAAIFSLTPVEVLLSALVACLSAPCVLVASTFALGRIAARASSPEPSNAYDVCRALIAESVAFGAATLSVIAEPYRPMEQVGLPAGSAPAKPVLLIHGIVCNRGVWRPLLERLRAAGFAPVRAVNLEPLFADIDSHAASVVREVRELHRESNGAPVAIVAHSMGGLVARAALRSISPEVISHIVTIASPHHGTVIARFLRSLPARQMRPQSKWLQQLNASQEGHLPVPMTSIYSLQDNLIAPPRSAILQGSRLHELRGLGHLSLLRARQSIDCALAALSGA